MYTHMCICVYTYIYFNEECCILYYVTCYRVVVGSVIYYELL